MNKKIVNDENSLHSRIANELSIERLYQGKSQAEIAEKMGTSVSGISRFESGRQNATLDYIEAFADALDKKVMFVMENPEVPYGNNSTVYSLKLYDEELMRFKLTKAIGLKCEIVSINEEKKQLLPLELEISEDGIIKWIRRRSIPQNRAFVGDILCSLGLSLSDVKGILDICMGLSLNDSYWVTPISFECTFVEYNLYQNPFSEALSLIAYAGGSHQTKNFRTSPELTTGGMLRKGWRFSRSKGIWLYKGGSYGFSNSGNEPFSEYVASQVAEAMGLHAITYELEHWKGILASKCKLFTDIDTAFVPIGRIVKTGGIEACIDYYKSLGDNFYQELASMLVFDAVIVNEDRHFGNFGLLRDNHTGEIVSPAPIFDNGLSLLCYAMKVDFDSNLDNYISQRSNPYGIDYFVLARSVMGPLQREQLRHLLNFHIRESDIVSLPSWRMKALEEMIRERARKLL